MPPNESAHDRGRPIPDDAADAAVEMTLPCRGGPDSAAPNFVDASAADTTGLGAAATPTKPYPPPQPPADEAEPPLPQLPGYQVVARVARGGMGEVLEARHLLLNRTVAIKLPLAHLMKGFTERERFLQEARAAAQLRHPRICAIHEVGQAGDCPYIVMDFIRGQTLKQWRSQHEPTARQAAEWVAALARAVAYAHEHGVIHRDLKPSNVLVDAESNSPVLTDFGLAKQVGDQNSQLTQSGQVMGTPAYMAPEQAAGQLEAVGPRSDVYSLGAVLYELLCGQPPFRGPTGSVLRQVQSEEPPLPRTINRRIHRDLETVCLKAMAKDPQARYLTAAALAEDLERFAAGEPIQARRLGYAARLGRWVHRRPAMTAALMAAVAAVALAAWLAVKAGSSYQLTHLNQVFEAALDSAELDDDRLPKMEAMIDELAALSPEHASAARPRLYRRFADQHHALLRKATLEDSDTQRIERALDVLHEHAPDLEPPLQQAFAERQRAWETVLALARGQQPPAVFPDGAVKACDDGFVTDAAKTPGRTVIVTLVNSPGNVELEAVFGPNWRESSDIGLVLNAVSDDKVPAGGLQATPSGVDPLGYYFRLRASVDARDENGAPAEARPIAFAKADMTANVALEIARGTTTLTRQRITLSSLAGKELRISAGRSAERVWAQVGNQPPLEFRDVFPISRAQPGRFGLVWPTGVTLVELRGRRQRSPVAASALERGDELFSQENFTAALEAYQSEQIASVGTPAAQEARYKAALCLAALERPEARQRLQELAVEEGDRWPVLAACRVWADDLRRRRFDDAEAIFESLRARYRFEELAALIPSDLRAEILRQYNQQAVRFSLFSRDPQRVERLRRAVEAEELLGTANHAHYSARWSLLRALEVSGQFDEALALAEQMVGEGGPWQDAGAINWIDEDCWLLSLSGRTEEALARVDRQVFDAAGQYRNDRKALLICRARLLAAIERWDEAEHTIDEFFSRATAGDAGGYYPVAALVRGLLRERRGDQVGAVAAWRQGCSLDDAAIQNGSALTANLILASLTGDMTDEQAARLSNQLIQSFASGTPFATMKDMVRVPPAVLREMWRTPRGREAARQIGFRLVSMADFVRLPALVFAVELAHQSGFSGRWNDEQEQVIWELMSASMAHYLDGTITTPQTANLAMTWKGSTSFLGWSGVSGTLPAAYRAQLAYLFAHRYLALGKADDARTFLRTALADSPADARVHRLAEAELEAGGLSP
jgi:tetratricopeptide (TPR) repeat protein